MNNLGISDLGNNKLKSGENFAKKREIAKKIQGLLNKNEKILENSDWEGILADTIKIYLSIVGSAFLIDFFQKTNFENLSITDFPLTIYAFFLGAPAYVAVFQTNKLLTTTSNKIRIVLQKRKFQKISRITK